MKAYVYIYIVFYKMYEKLHGIMGACSYENNI